MRTSILTILHKCQSFIQSSRDYRPIFVKTILIPGLKRVAIQLVLSADINDISNEILIIQKKKKNTDG